MYKYANWTQEELCKAEKELLMTLAEVRKERKESGVNSLDDNQLDIVSKSIDSIKDIYEMRLMMHTNKDHIMSSMAHSKEKTML